MPPLLVKYVAGVCCSIPMILLAAAGFAEQQRYSPVYEDIVCYTGTTSVRLLKIAPLRLQVVVNVDCSNPNPYNIQVRTNGLGDLLLGDAKIPAGKTRSRPAVLEAEKGGTLQFELLVEMSFFRLIRFIPNVLSKPVNVFFGIKLLAHVSPTLMLITPTEFEVDVQKRCGIQVRLSRFQGRSGGAVCENTFEQLQIPLAPGFNESQSSIGIGNTTGFRLGATSSAIVAKADPELVKNAGKTVDLICIICIVIGLVSGLICMCLPFGLHWQSGRKQKKGIGMDSNTLPAQSFGNSVLGNNGTT